MQTEVLLAIGTVLVGVITVILGAAIPWAYTMNGRLTRIEEQMKFFRQHGPVDVREILARIEKDLKTSGR